ncbi:MAG TPA: sulfur carrier protein ThiS [Gemmatimonadales bacterium]|nr:sulfur carrier protein ThiS [Gemmatimonadales bacterium]
MTALTITLNGELREVAGPLTLAGLLAHLELNPETVVVEHNRRIVRRGELASHPVSTGDVVEIVHFVGGG